MAENEFYYVFFLSKNATQTQKKTCEIYEEVILNDETWFSNFRTGDFSWKNSLM